MDSKQLKQLITFVLWRMEVNLNRDTHITQDAHTPEREGVKYNSTAAINLLLGTACVESDCGHYIEQKNGGTALGIYQMERMTHDDIWHNYINHRPKLKAFMRGELGDTLLAVKSDSLRWNLRYATLMARLHYYRITESIPTTTNTELAGYWKRHYNTEKGKGRIEDFLFKTQRYT
jgi:hypothetical protein